MPKTTIQDRAAGAIMGPLSATPWASALTGTMISRIFAVTRANGSQRFLDGLEHSTTLRHLAIDLASQVK